MRDDAGLVRRLDHWIGGTARVPASGRYLGSRRPGTSEEVLRIADGWEEDVKAAVASAAAAAPEWSGTDARRRSAVLRLIAAAIRGRIDELVGMEMAETGKVRATARAEIEGAAAYFDYYAGLAHLPAGEVIDVGAGYHSYVRHEPFGVVAVITPWNAPLNQAARAVAPALAARNVVVVKPSEHASGTTLELAEMATGAGLPDGVLNVVTGVGERVGVALTRDPRVRKIVFTGSVAAGRAVARVAAERVVPLTLELGGKSPNIVFADADLDAAVAGAVVAFTTNAGQICSSGTRLLVSSLIHDEFTSRLVTALRSVRAGDAYGPMVTREQYEKVLGYIELGTQDGALVVTGGSSSEGWLVDPTVFVGVRNEMRIAREEIFGPVLVVIPFESEAEAVTIANDSDFGLSAGIWTRDLSRAHRVAASLEAGQVYVNEWVATLIETPFGGFKLSGHGREKGVEALRGYSQTKSVVVRSEERRRDAEPYGRRGRRSRLSR